MLLLRIFLLKHKHGNNISMLTYELFFICVHLTILSEKSVLISKWPTYKTFFFNENYQIAFLFV